MPGEFIYLSKQIPVSSVNIIYRTKNSFNVFITMWSSLTLWLKITFPGDWIRAKFLKVKYPMDYFEKLVSSQYIQVVDLA